VADRLAVLDVPARSASSLLRVEIITGSGRALAEIDAAGREAFLLVLTHGAGGGTGSKDILAARRAGFEAGAVVVRVTQPYRVRGARAPGSAPRQDEAWLEIISALRAAYPGLPLIQGGRSNGARVACRTARQAGAAGVIALAFPLHPPGKADDPNRSRAGELRSAGVPVLVINGDRDPFGIPDEADADKLIVLPGETHSLSRHPQAVTDAVASWLARMTGSLRPGSVAG
jgi:uncharacterized protein